MRVGEGKETNDKEREWLETEKGGSEEEKVEKCRRGRS